jgi:ornithine decarboxylase
MHRVAHASDLFDHVLARSVEDMPLRVPTPYLAFDVEKALDQFDRLKRALPGTAVHYAVKANPHRRLLWRLARVGGRFDVASPGEVRLACDAGASADELLYSNPVKRRADIESAHQCGVRLFVADSMPELEKLADAAPHASVLARLSTSGRGSQWPLSRKFGATADECLELLSAAPGLGLDPAGIAFHVGSQQEDPDAWRDPIAMSATVYDLLRRRGIRPPLLDLGGGFPSRLDGSAPDVELYGRAIESALVDSFRTHRPDTLIEPGRAVTADAGVIVASVVAVCWRGGVRWVYLDAGVFTGLAETLDEAIRYPLRTDRTGALGPAVLAGPTCDSADVMYEQNPVMLPLGLTEGDEVRLLSTGAYTTTYATVGFNGFPPLPTRLVDELP